MRVVRFRERNGEGYRLEAGYGLLEGNRVRAVEGDLFGRYSLTGRYYPVEEVKLLAPCSPSKVVCVGLNYSDHAAEWNLPVPEEPILFLKPATAVVGPGEPVVLPSSSRRVDFEAELVVVVGRVARRVRREEALDYVFGYTLGNDVTARDFQKKDGQWTRAKSFDTFCPLGPWVETGVDASDLAIEFYLNGERKQASRTSNLIFPVDYLVSFISRVMTLLPGDVILTGTPAGVGSIHPGDEMEVRIEGIGSLRNPVVSDEDEEEY